MEEIQGQQDISTFCDIHSASTLEKTLMMCIERIEKLEHQLDITYQEFKEMKVIFSGKELQEKEDIIRDLLVMEPKSVLTFDIFGFLLGMSPQERSKHRYNEFILQVLPTYKDSISERVQYLYSLLQNSKAPWEITEDDLSIESPFRISPSYGSNLYEVLQAMTMDELRGYWRYRLLWTQCINISSST
jgi:hypothetical protein